MIISPPPTNSYLLPLCFYRTFISTGSCPYNDRCVFLHDPRTVSSRIIYRTKQRKSKEDLCQDSFFWPTMPRHEVVGRLDFRNLPLISQHYVVPHPTTTTGTPREMRNNYAVYSMWSHFLDFLAADPNSVIRIPRRVDPPNAYDEVNQHTGKRRLPVFVSLSCTDSSPLKGPR
jgi:Zinc finger C-x8-C-x5-C-x3-H type (and similar)